MKMIRAKVGLIRLQSGSKRILYVLNSPFGEFKLQGKKWLRNASETACEPALNTCEPALNAYEPALNRAKLLAT